MADQKLYNAPGLDIGHLGQALAQWFRSQDFEVQVLPGPNGLVVQSRKAGGWRSAVGLSAALNVTLILQGDQLLVQVGAAEWADKAVLGTVGALIFWPALIPAAYGAWKQSQLPAMTFRYIDQYMALGGNVTEADLARIATAAASMPARQEARCPKCGKVVRAEAKFCDGCGASLAPACPKCGKAVRADAKFCDGCGASLVLACPKCGAALHPGARFCDSCGAAIGPAQGAPPGA